MSRSGNGSVSANQAATAESYDATCANASPARSRRVSSESEPPSEFSSSSMKPYRSGSVTTATEWKFFAAARTIVGPPMSMFAITSASDTPRRAATDRNGYRLQTTRSIGSIPAASSEAMSSG